MLKYEPSWRPEYGSRSLYTYEEVPVARRPYRYLYQLQGEILYYRGYYTFINVRDLLSRQSRLKVYKKSIKPAVNVITLSFILRFLSELTGGRPSEVELSGVELSWVEHLQRLYLLKTIISENKNCFIFHYFLQTNFKGKNVIGWFFYKAHRKKSPTFMWALFVAWTTFSIYEQDMKTYKNMYS